MEPEGSLPNSQLPAKISLSSASLIQSITPNTTSLRSILILSSYPCLYLASGLISSVFPTKTLYVALFPPYMLRVPPT